MIIFSRNPNEGTPEPGSPTARPERTKLKNSEWTAYEAIHKKYLNIGESNSSFCYYYFFFLVQISTRRSSLLLLCLHKNRQKIEF